MKRTGRQEKMENRNPYEITSGFVERSGIFSYTQQVQRLNQLHRKVPTLCQSISQHASKQISGSLAHEYSFDRGMYAETNDYSLTVTRKGWRRHSFKDSGCIPNHPIRWIPKAHSQVVSEGSNVPEEMLKVERSQHVDMTSSGARYAERLGTIIKDLKDRENQAYNVLNHQKMGSMNRGIEGISANSLPEGNPVIKQTLGTCKNTIPVSTQPGSKNKTGTLIREKDTAHQAKSSVWPDAQFQPEKFKQISVPITNLQYRSGEKQDIVVGLESSQSGTNVVESSQVINAVSKDYGAAYVTGIMDKQSKYNQDWETKMFIMSKIAEYNKLSNQKAPRAATPNETAKKCLKSDEKLIQSLESGFEKEKERKKSSAMFKAAINKSRVYSTKQNVKTMQNQSEISVPESKRDISSFDNTSIFKTKNEKPFKTTCTSVNNPPKVNQNIVYVEKQFHQVSSENKHVSSFRSGPNSTSNKLALNCMASKSMKLNKCSPNNSHSTKEKLVEVKHVDETLNSCFDSKGLGTIIVCKPMDYGKDSRKEQSRAADKTPNLHIYSHSTESVDVSLKDHESRNGKPKPSKRVRFGMNTCKVIEPVTSTAKTLDSTYENRINKANHHNSRELSKMKEKFREDILQKNPLFGLRKTYSSDDIKTKAKLFKKNLNESVSVKGKNSTPSCNSESNKNLAKTQGLCMKSSGENIKVSTEKLECSEIQLQVETVRDSRMAKSGPLPELIRSAWHQTIDQSSDLLQFSPTSDIVRKKHLDVVHQGNSKETAKPMILNENKMSRISIIVKKEKNGKEFKSEKRKEASERKKITKTVQDDKQSQSASVSNGKSEMLKKLLTEVVENKSNLKHKNKMNVKKDNVNLVFEKTFDLPNQSKNNKVKNKDTSMKKNLEEKMLMKQHGHEGHGISGNRQINPKLHDQGKRKILSPEFNNQPNWKVKMQAPTSLCNIYEYQSNQNSVAATYKSQLFAPGNVYPSNSEIPGTIKPKTQTSQTKVYNVTSKQPLFKSKPQETPILDHLHHISSCTPSLEVMSNISTSSRKAGVHHTNHLSSAAKQLSLSTSAVVGDTHSTQSLPIQRSYFIATTGDNLINGQSTMTLNSNTIANSNKNNNLNSNKSSTAASPHAPVKLCKMDNLKNCQAPVAKKQQFKAGPSKMYNSQSSQLCRPHIRAEVRKLDERIIQQALNNKNDISVRDRSNQTSHVLTSYGKTDATRTKQSNVKPQNSTTLKKVNIPKIPALVQPPFPVSSRNSEVHGTNKLSLSVNSYDQGVHVKIDNAHNNQLPHTVKSSDKVAFAELNSTQSNHLPPLVKFHNQDAPTKVDNAGNNQLLSSVRFMDSVPAAKVDNNIHNSHQLQLSVKSQDKVVPARAVNTHNQLSSVKFNDQTAPAKVDNTHNSKPPPSVKPNYQDGPAKVYIIHKSSSLATSSHLIAPAAVDTVHNNKPSPSLEFIGHITPAKADVINNNQLSPSVKSKDQEVPAKVDIKHNKWLLQSLKHDYLVAPANAINTCNNQLSPSVKSTAEVAPANADTTHSQLSPLVKSKDETSHIKADTIHTKLSPSVKSNYQVACSKVDDAHSNRLSPTAKSNGQDAPIKNDDQNNNQLLPPVKSNGQDAPIKNDQSNNQSSPSEKSNGQDASIKNDQNNNQSSPSEKSNGQDAPIKNDQNNNQLSLSVKSNGQNAPIKNDQNNNQSSPSEKSNGQDAPIKNDDQNNNQLLPPVKSNGQDAPIKNDQSNNQSSPSEKSNGQDASIKNDQNNNQLSLSVKSNGQDAPIKNDQNNNQLSPSEKSNGQDKPLKNDDQNNNQLSPSVKSNGQYAPIKNDDGTKNQLSPSVKSYSQDAPIKNDQNNNQLLPPVKFNGQVVPIKNDQNIQLSPSAKPNSQDVPIKNDDQNLNQLLPPVKSYGQDAPIKNDDQTKNQLSPSVKYYSQDAPIKHDDQNNNQLSPSVNSNGQDEPLKIDDRNNNLLSPSVKSNGQDEPVKNDGQNNNQLSPSVKSYGHDSGLNWEDFERYLPEGSLFSFSPDLTDLTNFILDYSAESKKFDEVANLSPPVLSPAVPTEYNRYTEMDPISHVGTTVINDSPTFTVSTTNSEFKFETAIKSLQKDSISAADGVSGKSNVNEIQFHEVCGEGDLSLTDKLSKAQCKTGSQSGADGQEQRGEDDIVSSVASSCELLRKPIDMKSAETQCGDLVGRKVSLNSKSVGHKSNKKETVKYSRMITRSATRQASNGVLESKNSKIRKVKSIVQNVSNKQRQSTVINTVNKFETGLSTINTANYIAELSIKTTDPSIDVEVNDDGADNKKGRVARKRKSSMELPLFNTDAGFLDKTFNEKTCKKRCTKRVGLLASENVQTPTIKPKAIGMAKTRSPGPSESSRAKIDTKAWKCLSSQVNTELGLETKKTKLVGKRGRKSAEADDVTIAEKCNQSMQGTSGVPFVQPKGGSFSKKRAKLSHHEMKFEFANTKGTDAKNSRQVNLTKRKANKVTMRGNKKTGPELKVQLTDIMIRNKTSQTLQSKKDCKRPRTDIKNNRTKVDISGSCITGETHTKMKPSLKPKKGHKKGMTSTDRKERINTVTRMTTSKDDKQILKNKTFADEFTKCTLCDVKIHPSRKLSHFKHDHPRTCDVCYLELPSIVSSVNPRKFELRFFEILTNSKSIVGTLDLENWAFS